MGPKLDWDILYSIVAELAISRNASLKDLLNVSVTCHLLRDVSSPAVFAEVQWPHADKHTAETGLEFFPGHLWRYFKRFSLVWPDHWPDCSPPLWGDRYYVGGDYHPRHLDKLVSALPQMPSLSSFHMSCPFYPPNSIITTVVQCPSMRELSIHDTPLYVAMIPRVPPDFHLERISIVPVAEALRVGEGPYDTKYQEVIYYIRDFRKRYKNDSLARYAASAFLFKVGKADSLSHVQISGDLCTLQEIAEHEWPNLRTLIFTGHAPRRQGAVELPDVIARMPKLRDLRLLFATIKSDSNFRLVPTGHYEPTARGNTASMLLQIKYLALSNACHLPGVFRYATKLERLLICAIIDLPRVPIALNRADIDAILNDVAIGSTSDSSQLKLLRIMIEDKANPELYHKLCLHFRHLEFLEVELCGYHDGKSIYAWYEFVEALSSLAHLKHIRLCIQFPEFDETDPGEPWRAARKECAEYFAAHITSLQRVGFEYRKRTGTHRYEDSWLEFDIERRLEGGTTELTELPPSWYKFPEVWEPEYMHSMNQLKAVGV